MWLHSHYGTQLKGEKNNNDFLYNSFISYTARDEEFLHQIFVPNLFQTFENITLDEDNINIYETTTEAKTELSSEITDSNALLGDQDSNTSTTRTIPDDKQTASYSEIEMTESTNKAEPVTEEADNEVVYTRNQEAPTESESGVTGSGLTAIATEESVTESIGQETKN